MQLDWIDTLNRRKQTRETYSLWSYLISLKLNLTWSFLHWIVAEEGTYSRVIKKNNKKNVLEILTHSDELNWAKRRTFHETNRT